MQEPRTKLQSMVVEDIAVESPEKVTNCEVKISSWVGKRARACIHMSKPGKTRDHMPPF
jgi:hypothetical protein